MTAGTRADEATFDLAVIGGGVNGCGIARDAAGRGARVLLLEAGDIAGATSSASSKLVHGGLRYLEHGEFALVREALAERERLWRIAPHLVRPLRFVMPVVPGLRPLWQLRTGLFLYDHLAPRRLLPPAQTVRLDRHPAGAALKPEFDRALVYSDCWVDDARLVVLNARDAADRGAQVRTRCPVQKLTREDGAWRIDTPQGWFRARAVVNAAGPWALDLLARAGAPARRPLRLVRGSHIAVRRLFDHSHPYVLQMPDRRILFAMPWERDYTLIGTTDRDHTAGLDRVEPGEDEIAYLCDGASRFFRQAVTPADVVLSFAGVRPLVDDGSGRPEAASRGYRLELGAASEGAPLLSVLGGKLSTYRQLAETAVARLAERLPQLARPGWTASAALPGGDFSVDGLPTLEGDLAARYPFLGPANVQRLARAYGTRAFALLGEAARVEDCGEDFGGGLCERELRWLVDQEWARTAEDVLWRRSKLGLRLNPAQTARVEEWMAHHGG